MHASIGLSAGCGEGYWRSDLRVSKGRHQWLHETGKPLSPTTACLLVANAEVQPEVRGGERALRKGGRERGKGRERERVRKGGREREGTGVKGTESGPGY